MYTIKPDRQHLCGSLKGKRMHVPDLKGVFSDWPSAFNSELESLRLHVDERLKSIVEQQSNHKSECALALKKMQAPNYALLGAYWWPFVSAQTLYTMTNMAIWIALWDDVFEKEAPTFGAGSLSTNWEEAQNYRFQTLLFIREALQLPCGSSQQRPDNVLITSFEDIASHVNTICSTEQRERLYKLLEQHVDATAEKQQLRMSTRLPTISQYLQVRMATSGVRVCALLLEMCEDAGIEPDIRRDPNVKKLIDQVNIMILVTNDMCSLKSKLTRGSVDNLVALLWLSHADLDSAVSVAMSVLESAKKDFDNTAKQLVADHSEDGVAHPDLHRLIMASQAACAGNMVWSLSMRKYDVHIDEKDNRRAIVL